mgnify:FL=1
MIGRDPRESIVTDGHIPWELALDELASERGYRSDEDLKEAIEATAAGVKHLTQVKHDARHFEDKAKHAAPCEQIQRNVPCAVAGQKRCTAETLACNGNEIKLVKEPSQWIGEVDGKEQFSTHLVTDARRELRELIKPLTMHKMPEFDDTYKGPRFKYGLQYRPVGYANIPDGWIINSDHPHKDFFKFGTIEYPYELGQAEIDSFQLVPLDMHKPSHRVVEKAVTICETSKGHLVIGNQASGTEDKVSLTPACPGGSKIAGIWHRHPGEYAPEPSAADISETQELNRRHGTGKTMCITGMEPAPVER